MQLVYILPELLRSIMTDLLKEKKKFYLRDCKDKVLIIILDRGTHEKTFLKAERVHQESVCH